MNQAGAAQAQFIVHRIAGIRQEQTNHIADNKLLGEVLGADDYLRFTFFAAIARTAADNHHCSEHQDQNQ